MKNEEVHKSAPNETFELSDQWRMTVRGFSIFLDLFIFRSNKIIVRGSR
jgi:hypothetical protein